MDKALHIGFGHYGIGFKDGVNTVIARNVRALRDIDPSLRITLFGKLSADYKDFIFPENGSLEYLNIEEFDPECATRKFGQKSIMEQQVHDYIWQGTLLAEILVGKLSDMDVIIMENLGIGIDPTVTYAFYLYTQYCYTRGVPKRFIYRFHDFVQQRPVNFMNIKKFHHPRFGVAPNWHSVLYPAYPNIQYISINRYDRSRLVEHGIEESRVFYIPNSIDRSIIPRDDRGEELRKRIIQRDNLDPNISLILYPVRCVRRKNVEEAIFLARFFNALAEGKSNRKNSSLKGKFHLLVSLRPTGGDDAVYADHLTEFIRKHRLPVSIGFNDLVSLQREYDPEDPSLVRRYGIGDMYRASELVITTSILEGFGFAYLEPWLLDRAVIGRSIPMITPDFQAKGMKLGHLYTALIVDKQDFKDIGLDRATSGEALGARLEKILKLDNPAFVDQFIESNETAVTGTLKLFDREKRKSIIKKNRAVVEESYSQDNIGRILYRLITSD